jgi:hypothetical protein
MAHTSLFVPFPPFLLQCRMTCLASGKGSQSQLVYFQTIGDIYFSSYLLFIILQTQITHNSQGRLETVLSCNFVSGRNCVPCSLGVFVQYPVQSLFVRRKSRSNRTARGRSSALSACLQRLMMLIIKLTDECWHVTQQCMAISMRAGSRC